MGCLKVSVQRLVPTLQTEGGVYTDLKVNVGLVCSVNLGSEGVLWASDERLLTFEGGYLIVR